MSKERLTKTSYNPCDECNYAFHKYNQESGMCKLCEFKNYRDLEEQGLLLRLPISAGSEVHLISSRYTKCTKYDEEFNEGSCLGCVDECDSRKEYYIHKNSPVSLEWIVNNLGKFGKTVFLTQSEAEEKLRELEGK